MLAVQVLFYSLCAQIASAIFSEDMQVWRQDPAWKHSNSSYRHITLYQTLECRENPGQHMQWLKLDNFDQCVTVISDFQILPCVYSQFIHNNMTYKVKSKKHLLSRDLKSVRVRVRPTSCSAYMIFTSDDEFLHRLFTKNQRHFRPFTKIFMVSPPSLVLRQQNVLDAMGHGYKIFAVKSPFFNISLDYVDLNYISLYNPYMNQTLNASIDDAHAIDDFYGQPSNHALFDKKVWRYQKKVFKVGVFHCPPYIMITNNRTKE